jgi:hypothetical protein
VTNDLKVFDQQFGFPNPDLQIIKFGNVPAFDSTNATMVGWAEETTLDVYLDNTGNRVQPDSVWNDGFGAGGGGVSAVFSRPLYQAGVGSVVGRHRGTPDISMSASVNGGAWVYMSFAGIESPGVSDPGWYIFGGTSEATPIFSGIVALADQVAGHRLGLINPALHALGRASGHGAGNTGLVDITAGNNSFAGVTGYDAGPGYDLASGWGHHRRGQVRPGPGPGRRLEPPSPARRDPPQAGSRRGGTRREAAIGGPGVVPRVNTTPPNLTPQEPAGELGHAGLPPGPGFLAVGPAHRVQAGVRAQPAQRLGLPLR